RECPTLFPYTTLFGSGPDATGFDFFEQPAITVEVDDPVVGLWIVECEIGSRWNVRDVGIDRVNVEKEGLVFRALVEPFERIGGDEASQVSTALAYVVAEGFPPLDETEPIGNEAVGDERAGMKALVS